MTYNFKQITALLFVILAVINFSGCFYSFTGASVPPHLKTVFIPPLDDRSGSGEIRLRESLKDVLTQKFNNDNTLQVAERANADCLLECTIVSFTDASAVVTASNQGNESVTGKRISIGVKVLFKDLVKKKTISEKSYSGTANYESSGNVVTSRSNAIDQAVDRITEDILIGTVSNW